MEDCDGEPEQVITKGGVVDSKMYKESQVAKLVGYSENHLMVLPYISSNFFYLVTMSAHSIVAVHYTETFHVSQVIQSGENMLEMRFLKQSGKYCNVNVLYYSPHGITF